MVDETESLLLCDFSELKINPTINKDTFRATVRGKYKLFKIIASLNLNRKYNVCKSWDVWSNNVKYKENGL